MLVTGGCASTNRACSWCRCALAHVQSGCWPPTATTSMSRHPGCHCRTGGPGGRAHTVTRGATLCRAHAPERGAQDDAARLDRPRPANAADGHSRRGIEEPAILRELPIAERERRRPTSSSPRWRSLNRLFQNLLDMARLDAGAVGRPSGGARIPRWSRTTHAPPPRLSAPITSSVDVDGRDTGARGPAPDGDGAGPEMENAAQHAPPATDIAVTARVQADGLHLTVRDQGPASRRPTCRMCSNASTAARSRRPNRHRHGPMDCPRLLAAQGGEIWAENAQAAGPC